MRTRYKIDNNDSFYFVTSTTVDWIKIFTTDEYYKILINAIKFYQSQKRLEIIAYVFLPNHFHLIIQSNELINIMKLIKAYSAKEIIKLLRKDNKDKILELFHIHKKEYKTGSNYQIWQEGFKPKKIISDKMLGQKINYIHFNPAKAGLVEEVQDWKYSSADFYFSGKDGVIKPDIKW